MTLHCNTGEKATVIYSFADSIEETYTSLNTPVDVYINRIAALGGFSNADYQVYGTCIWQNTSYNYGGSFGGANVAVGSTVFWGIQIPVKGVINSYYFDINKTTRTINLIFTFSDGREPASRSLYLSSEISGVSSDQFSYSESPEPNKNALGSNFEVKHFIRTDGQIDPPQPSERDEVIIKYNNQTIYADIGKAPGKYRVACDNECPKGYIKISTIKYPGYKCREKCPPETCCECDCGDIICCYGSNGQVLKTIPN